ncbi:MAG TPA: antibiotic biosynthesis monooxygenase [Gaiellaceae bacterium]|nr:antibiotic biosynthesis monooxygenase [Gaiellaceae bacterium]
MICTSGIWTVRQGRADEFQRRWQEMVDGMTLDYPELKCRLLRDHREPTRFVSFDEGWRSIEQVEEASSMPSYQDAIAAVWRVLDEGETATLELVAEVS